MTKNHMHVQDGIGGKWTQVPNEIIRAGKDVFATTGEKMTYISLLSYAFQIEQEARPSQKTIANDVICSDRAVRNHLKTLEEKGFLQKAGYHDDGIVIWRVVIPPHLRVKWLRDQLAKEEQKMEAAGNLPDPENKPDAAPTEQPKPAAKQKKKLDKSVAVHPGDDEIPFDEIIAHLNKVTGKSYDAMGAENRFHIRARWNDGYTLEQFKKVVDVKTPQWIDEAKTNAWLRPKTLFGPKMVDYVNENPKPQQPKKSSYIRNESDFIAGRKEENSGRFITDPNGRVWDLENEQDKKEFEEEKQRLLAEIQGFIQKKAQ